MLVALYRANPQAFVSENMNRLKAGAVLNVPQADAERRYRTPRHSRIQAQSAISTPSALAGGCAAPESGTRRQRQTAVED
jgi:pilus assembly protein FimV